MIDLTYLNSLMGGDEALTRRFLELFRTEMPGQLQSLEHQFQQGNLADANRIAHAIKGQLQTLGLTELAGMARQIEEDTEEGNPVFRTNTDLAALKTGIAELMKSIP